MRTSLIVGASALSAAAAAAGAFAAFKAVKGGRDDEPVDAQVVVLLKGNEKLFQPKELALIQELIARDQGHLFAAWPAPGTQDHLKRKLLSQLISLNGSYHGGLSAYIDNAKQLLKDSKEGRNPFDDYTPGVPDGVKLDFASQEFIEYQQAGLKQAASTAFVLVAGGLGERLGYKGIKVALPCESATGWCFLELYSRWIKALQDASKSTKKLPFTIMTSDDTHKATVELLRTHKYFGLDPAQVHLVKQEKVACLIDNEAHLSLDPADSYALQTKPHGHGDVHALLHSSGLAKRWHADGFKWVAFFQDTNALVFWSLTAALGVSGKFDYDMNSLAVPRKAKEAIGAIACLKHKDGGSITCNVEYNQLDPLLRSTISPQGDVNDETGWSPFPGNINQLVLKLDTYVHQLHKTGGIISEFVNPKYKDASKTTFKSSTRLECMMQDYPKALPKNAKVGFTSVNQVWASYSPVKNNPTDALAKFKEGEPTHSATTAEVDIYRTNCYILEKLAGAHMPANDSKEFNGIRVSMTPRIVLSPEFAPVLAHVRDKVTFGCLTMHSESVLVLDGDGIDVQGPVEVQGALVVRAPAGKRVHVERVTLRNAGWTWQPLELQDKGAKEEERIRGFRVLKTETSEWVASGKGDDAMVVAFDSPSAPSHKQATDAIETPQAAVPAVGTDTNVPQSAPTTPTPVAAAEAVTEPAASSAPPAHSVSSSKPVAVPAASTPASIARPNPPSPTKGTSTLSVHAPVFTPGGLPETDKTASSANATARAVAATEALSPSKATDSTQQTSA